MKETEKTAVLLKLIDALCDANFSKDQNTITEWINKLNEVYSDNYRHTYSDIFFKIQKIMSDDMSNSAESNTEVLETLGENLNVLGEQIEQWPVKNSCGINYQDTLAGYKKFSDHINLEIGRYNFYKSKFENQSTPSIGSQSQIDLKRITQIEDTIDTMRSTVANAQKGFDGLDEKLESNKISSITTLTIFSAVILAFSGGITFESGIFKGMVESSAYRLVFTIALSGFILFNTIFVLLYLVGKMAGKRISTKCKYLVTGDDEYNRCQPCGDGYCAKECAESSIACRIIHKYSYVFVVDVLLIYVMYSDFFLWLSNGLLLDPRFYLSQGFLIFLLVMSIIVHLSRKHNRQKRIKLHYKVIFLRNIIASKDNNSVYYNLYQALTGLRREILANSAYDSFLEKINNMDKDSALKYLDEYVDEYLVSDRRSSISITKREYKVDCRNLNSLLKKFKSL